MFLFEIKNIFAGQQANVACSLLTCQFGYVNLASSETGKEKSDQAPMDTGETMLTTFARHKSRNGHRTFKN